MDIERVHDSKKGKEDRKISKTEGRKRKTDEGQHATNRAIDCSINPFS